MLRESCERSPKRTPWYALPLYFSCTGPGTRKGFDLLSRPPRKNGFLVISPAQGFVVSSNLWDAPNFNRGPKRFVVYDGVMSYGLSAGRLDQSSLKGWWCCSEDEEGNGSKFSRLGPRPCPKSNIGRVFGPSLSLSGNVSWNCFHNVSLLLFASNNRLSDFSFFVRILSTCPKRSSPVCVCVCVCEV